MERDKLYLTDLALDSGFSRGIVKLLYWVAMGLFVLLGIILAIQEKQHDSEFMFNLGMNAISSGEGFLNMMSYQSIFEFPVIYITSLVSMVFLVYSFFIAVKLITDSREFIGAILIVICGFINSMFLFNTNFDSFGTLSLWTSILFIATGIYYFVRGAELNSELGMIAVAMIIYGGELFWPRYYKLANYTFSDSGIWMTLVGVATLAFLLYSGKAALCDSE